MAYGMSVKSPTGQEMISGYEVNNISTIVPTNKNGWNTVTLPPLGPGQYYSYCCVNGAALETPNDWCAKPDTIKISGNILTFLAGDSKTGFLGIEMSGFFKGQGIVVVGGRV